MINFIKNSVGNEFTGQNARSLRFTPSENIIDVPCNLCYS